MVGIAELLITLPQESSAAQGRLVRQLQTAMQDVEGIAQTEIKRARDDSQDAGTILSIVLAAPAVVVAVKALAAWLVRTNQGKISIVTADGQVIDASGLESGDVSKTVEALKQILEPRPV